MAQVELSIININDVDGALEVIQAWLNEWRDQLDFVSENEGCSKAINLWTIRGEEQLINNIILDLPEQVRNLPMPIN
ncbi:MAG TPA: hypothetical protein DCS93_02370 [Microscillaceae bacterium]|nr:hypothetical protein [Microscillaceae bacterium]